MTPPIMMGPPRFVIAPSDAYRALKAHGIDLYKWNKPPAKSVQDLEISLLRERTELWLDQGKLVLCVNVSVIHVRKASDKPGWVQELYEAERHFPGNVRKEGRPFDGSIGETIERDETPESASVRGLAQELGFYEGYELRNHLPVETMGPMLSPDHYPGLPVLYYRHKSIAVIKGKVATVPEYIERAGNGRKTIFRWRMIARADIWDL